MRFLSRTDAYRDLLRPQDPYGSMTLVVLLLPSGRVCHSERK